MIRDPHPQRNGHRNRAAASPRARRALREKGLSPAVVPGTGPGGRIVEADVLRYDFALTAAKNLVAPNLPPPPDASTIRRAIARVTSNSAATVPQFQLRAEVDAANLVVLRRQLLHPMLSNLGLRLSYTDLLLRAQALALRDCPRANAMWRDDGLLRLPRVCVGLVVALDEGLLIPTIADADQLSLRETVRRRHALVNTARNGGRLGSANQEAASSLTNLGHTRVDEFSAMISPPQSSMLAVGRLAPRPFAIDNQLTVRPTLRLTLTVDHRVLDGTPAAEFLGRIVDYLEQPARMLFADSELSTNAEPT